MEECVGCIVSVWLLGGAVYLLWLLVVAAKDFLMYIFHRGNTE